MSTAPCLMKPCPTSYSPAAAFICSSSDPWAMTSSVRRSKPTPTASRALGPLIAPANRTPSTDKLTFPRYLQFNPASSRHAALLLIVTLVLNVRALRLLDMCFTNFL